MAEARQAGEVMAREVGAAEAMVAAAAAAREAVEAARELVTAEARAAAMMGA